MAQPTIAVSAYTAGIIDGEGCIYIRKSIRRRGKSNQPLVYSLHVDVTSIDRRVIDWLQGKWSGNVREMRQSKSGFNPDRLYWRWMVAANRADAVLRAALPYMQIKDNQARVAIAFQVLSRGNRGTQWHNSSWERYDELYGRLKALKRQRAEAETERLGTDNGEATVQPSVKTEIRGTLQVPRLMPTLTVGN